jgi:hypothetical protein
MKGANFLRLVMSVPAPVHLYTGSSCLEPAGRWPLPADRAVANGLQDLHLSRTSPRCGKSRQQLGVGEPLT